MIHVIVQLKGNNVFPKLYVMDMPYDIRPTYRKIDFQLPGNLTDHVILDTVQLPAKNHLFLDVSSDDLY